jgi:hypothetical protein
LIWISRLQSLLSVVSNFAKLTWIRVFLKIVSAQLECMPTLISVNNKWNHFLFYQKMKFFIDKFNKRVHAK